MANEQKTLKDTLTQEAEARDPGIVRGKKFIFRMCILLLVVRLVFAVSETVFIINRGLPLSSYFLNYLAMLVSILFAFGIYKGFKPLAWLLITGAAVSLLNLAINNLLAGFAAGDALYKFYVVALIVSMLVQIISMLAVILHSDSKKYFTSVTNVNKTLIEQASNKKQQDLKQND